jgi:hypothetical protein
MILHGSPRMQSAARRSEIFGAQSGPSPRERPAANGVSAGDRHALAAWGKSVWEMTCIPALMTDITPTGLREK